MGLPCLWAWPGVAFESVAEEQRFPTVGSRTPHEEVGWLGFSKCSCA